MDGLHRRPRGPVPLNPAGVQLADLRELGLVGAVAGARHLHVTAELLKRGMDEERPEALADLAFEDVRVTVAVRAKRR